MSATATKGMGYLKNGEALPLALLQLEPAQLGPRLVDVRNAEGALRGQEEQDEGGGGAYSVVACLNLNLYLKPRNLGRVLSSFPLACMPLESRTVLHNCRSFIPAERRKATLGQRSSRGGNGPPFSEVGGRLP